MSKKLESGRYEDAWRALVVELVTHGHAMEAWRALRTLWRVEPELADELAEDYLGCELWPEEL